MEAFSVLLEHLVSQDKFESLNQEQGEMTIASFCILKQSWHCFAHLIKVLGLNQVLESKCTNSYYTKKLPIDYADEFELLQEFEQIVAWFKSKDQTTTTLDSILETISQQTSSTLVITDYRCLDHATFVKGNVLSARVSQRVSQPENSDRLNILVDPKHGVLSKSTEFSELSPGLVFR